jgi:hypothetical protein
MHNNKIMKIQEMMVQAKTVTSYLMPLETCFPLSSQVKCPVTRQSFPLSAPIRVAVQEMILTFRIDNVTGIFFN